MKLDHDLLHVPGFPGVGYFLLQLLQSTFVDLASQVLRQGLGADEVSDGPRGGRRSEEDGRGGGGGEKKGRRRKKEEEKEKKKTQEEKKNIMCHFNFKTS